MTEDPQEKIRQNIAAYKAAITAGTHTQQDLDDYLSEVHEARTGKPFVTPTPDATETAGDRAMGAAATAYQGLTMGQGDKVIAALQTLGKASTGQVPSLPAARDDFNANRHDTRQVIDQYHARRPGAATAMEVAGSLPTLAVGGGRLANVGRRALNKVPAGTAKVVGREIPVVNRIMRVAGGMERLSKAAQKVAPVVEEASPAVEAAPQAEGLMGNGMDNVLEAIKAQGAKAPDDAIIGAIKRAPTRHRTQAQFDYIADRMRERAAADPNDLTGALEQSLKIVGKSGKLPSRNPFIP